MREPFGGLRLGIGKESYGLFLGNPEALFHASPPALPIGLARDLQLAHCEGSGPQFLRRCDGINRALLKSPLGALLRAGNDPVGAWPQTREARQADGAPI